MEKLKPPDFRETYPNGDVMIVRKRLKTYDLVLQNKEKETLYASTNFLSLEFALKIGNSFLSERNSKINNNNQNNEIGEDNVS